MSECWDGTNDNMKTEWKVISPTLVLRNSKTINGVTTVTTTTTSPPPESTTFTTTTTTSTTTTPDPSDEFPLRDSLSSGLPEKTQHSAFLPAYYQLHEDYLTECRNVCNTLSRSSARVRFWWQLMNLLGDCWWVYVLDKAKQTFLNTIPTAIRQWWISK